MIFKIRLFSRIRKISKSTRRVGQARFYLGKTKRGGYDSIMHNSNKPVKLKKDGDYYSLVQHTQEDGSFQITPKDRNLFLTKSGKRISRKKVKDSLDLGERLMRSDKTGIYNISGITDDAARRAEVAINSLKGWRSEFRGSLGNTVSKTKVKRKKKKYPTYKHKNSIYFNEALENDLTLGDLS